MPPKDPTAGAMRDHAPGRRSKAKRSGSRKTPTDIAKGKQRAQPTESPTESRPDPSNSDDHAMANDDHDAGQDDDDDDEEESPLTIPPALLTRILHEFFEKDGTRITKDANDAVAKYMDIFIGETIARAATERNETFLEVEDLEKIAPQLLFDM